MRTKKDKKKQGTTGGDLGIKAHLVCSDGTIIENPRAYEKAMRKLRRTNKKAARQRKHAVPGAAPSKRYERTVKDLRKQYDTVRSQEKDFAHKTSKWLVDNYELIGLENLYIPGMMRNKSLARHVAHAGWGRLREFTAYKAEWYGSELILVDRFFPSSKRCSSCGEVKAKLSLKERVYRCEHCGLVMDGDLNAALNIEWFILQVVAQSCGETLNGRGGGSSGSAITAGETTTCEASSLGEKSLGQPDLG